MGQNLKIVTLRVYKGKAARDFDDPSKVISENQTVKLTYGNQEWNIFLKHAQANYTRMNIELVQEEFITFKDTGRKDARGLDIKTRATEYKTIDAPENITSEVIASMSVKVAELTPEQKQIAAQQKQIDTLIAQLSAAPDSPPIDSDSEDDDTPNTNEELEVARKRYHELFDEKPHHMMQLKKLNKLIKEKETNS
jgi:hypothetical protein